MLELNLLSSKRGGHVSEGNPVLLSDMQPNSRWSPSGTTVSSELAPNGDTCELWRNDGASCKQIDLTAVLSGKPFILGCYIKPSSYQAQYGNSPPSAWVLQVGSFNAAFMVFNAKPGTGTAAYPKTNSVTGTTNLQVFSETVSPVDVWTHIALSFDPSTGKLAGFVNGAFFGETNSGAPSTYTLFMGGIGDRTNIGGGSLARYGYRGLISNIRYLNQYVNYDFDPLTF